MEEQTTQQEQQPITNPEPEQSDYQDPAQPEASLPEDEPEISLTEDGELKFKDDFFGDIKEKPSNDTPQPQQPTPNYYTDDELRDTPFEQWDLNRMPEDVKRYAVALNKQREAQFRQQQLAQRAQTQNPFLTPPKQYTPKELNDEATKLAVQKLGLKDADELDMFEGEHSAALKLAQDEVLQKHNAELAAYQRTQADWADLQSFHSQLAAQPDFSDFNDWYRGKLKSHGATQEQVTQWLEQVGRTYGLGMVKNVHLNWYREFQGERAKNLQSHPRAKTPPTLESTRGGNYEGRKTFNAREFSQLDDDAQAQALIKVNKG